MITKEYRKNEYATFILVSLVELNVEIACEGISVTWIRDRLG